MSLRFRLFIFILCALVFVIVVPFIFLQASGYRFDPREKTFRRTGSLFIESYPSGAEVLINGQFQEKRKFLDFFSFFWDLFSSAKYGGKTPTIINNLLPGKYKIKIIKEGFKKWEKEALIKPNLTTRFKKISLFLEKPELKLYDQGEVGFFKASPSGKKIIYQIRTDPAKKSLKLLENDKVNVLIDDFKLNLSNLIWSEEEKKIIFNQIFLLNLETGELIDLSRSFPFLKRKETKIKFDEKNSDFLYASLEKNLFKINLPIFERSFVLDTQGEIKDWQRSNGEIEMIIKRKDGLFLEKISLTSLQKPEFSLILPGENFVFEKTSFSNLRFLTNGERILLVTLEEKPVIFNLKGKKIIPAEDSLVYFDNHEIQILNLNPDPKLLFPWQREIITRLAEELKEVERKGDWLYYLSNNKIMALEIDFKNYQNQYLLFEGEVVKFHSKEPEIIYFTTPQGLSSLKIR